jgi:hypothetical protein
VVKVTFIKPKPDVVKPNVREAQSAMGVDLAAEFSHKRDVERLLPLIKVERLLV